MVYNPEKCNVCKKAFNLGDKVIKHDDLNSNWFFCSNKCYEKWLKVYRVKEEIIVGEEHQPEEIEEELLDEIF